MISVLCFLLDLLLGGLGVFYFSFFYIVCFAYTFKYRRKELLLTTIILGLLHDILFTSIIGFNTLLFLSLAYLVHKIKFLPLILVAFISFIVYVLSAYLLLFLLQANDFNIYAILIGTIYSLASAIPSFLLVYFLFKIIYINR